MENVRLPTDAEELLERVQNGEKFQYCVFSTKRTEIIDDSCFSMWALSPFKVGNHTFNTVEHWMMANRAWTFNDEELAKEIIGSPCPRLASILGNSVKGFDQETWDLSVDRIFFDGNVAKFLQNPIMNVRLMSTRGKVMVFAEQNDPVYGVGLDQCEPCCTNPECWPNALNKLGFTLMKTRDVILCKTYVD